MIREAIQAELRRRKMTVYGFVKHLGDRMPESTVYAYLAGTRDLSTKRADILLQSLGLSIRREAKKRK